MDIDAPVSNFILKCLEQIWILVRDGLLKSSVSCIK